MMPDPLHPAVVHLPLALAVLLPGLAMLGTFLIHRGFLPTRAWALLVLLQALLVGSAWSALETGEDQEDRVEGFVAERLIEAHEEEAERFLLLAGIGLLAMTVGLLPRDAGRVGRVVGSACAFGVLAAGLAAGHSGGELVYRHGAANAYVDAPGAQRTWHSYDDD